MKKLVLHKGGHKFRITDLNHLQTGLMEALAALANGITRLPINGSIDTPYILCGVEISIDSTIGGEDFTVSEGYIFWNNEVFYVPLHYLTAPVGTTAEQLKWSVDETVTPYDGYPDGIQGEVKYRDLTYKNVHMSRVLRVKTPATSLASYFLGSVLENFPTPTPPTPSGVITMWSGTYSGNFNISGLGIGNLSGWALCNGHNGTPDLRGRFIIGATDMPGSGHWNDPHMFTQRSTGGDYEVKLTAAQSGLPVHRHGITEPNDGNGHAHSYLYSQASGDKIANGQQEKYGVENTLYSGGTSLNTTGITINNSETADAAVEHENLPPYYTLAFIMKL